jgi:hypothetical protein
MNLYEIGSRYFSLLQAIEEGEIEQEDIADTLSAIDAEFEEKADNLACFIKNLKAEEKAIADEIRSLESRKKSKVMAIERLSEFLKSQLEFVGKTSFESVRNKLSIRKNPESVQIEEGFDNWINTHSLEADKFLEFPEPKIKKSAIKEALQKGETVPFVRLVKNERLEVK